MPTYEFRCPTGHEFEKFYRKMSDAPFELPCPECGQPAPRQVSGGAGLLFKGSGFYITDYGKDGKKAAAKSGDDKGGDAKPASAGEGGSKSDDSASGAGKPSGAGDLSSSGDKSPPSSGKSSE